MAVWAGALDDVIGGGDVWADLCTVTNMGVTARGGHVLGGEVSRTAVPNVSYRRHLKKKKKTFLLGT